MGRKDSIKCTCLLRRLKSQLSGERKPERELFIIFSGGLASYLGVLPYWMIWYLQDTRLTKRLTDGRNVPSVPVHMEMYGSAVVSEEVDVGVCRVEIIGCVTV